MSLRSISVLLITFILTVGASASTNMSMPSPLDKISNLSINFIEPNEDFIKSYNNEIVNTDDTVIISLIFREAIESNPKFSYSIYRATLTRLKEISEQDYLANKRALEHLMYNTLKDLESGVSKTASIDVDQSESITCLCAGEGLCGDGSEVEQCNADIDPGLTPLMASAGLVYATQSDDSAFYAGTSASYDSDLATTWSARQEYKNVGLTRDILTLSTGLRFNAEIGANSNLVNPYDILGVNDAYAHGFSGNGIIIDFLDENFCPDHLEFSGKTVTTFGTVSVATSGNSQHGCHVTGLALAKYNENSASANSTYDSSSTKFGESYENMKYSMMGVAYNASLNYGDFDGDNSNCSGDSDTDCWGPQHWELAAENAKSIGAKVSSHSWGWSPDGGISPAQLITYANDNSKTFYQALVDYQSIKTNGSTSDVGFSTGTLDWTVSQWQEYVAAIDSFQETGVWVNAMSNDGNNNYSTVLGAATNRTDLASGMPLYFSELSEAWINVANVSTFENGTKMLNSAPCATTAVYCVSHDGYWVDSSTFKSGSDHFVGDKSGTSMATPQVAGAVAILWEAFPDNTPEVITKRLLLTADNSWLSTNVCFSDANGSGGPSSTGDTWDDSCGGITGTLTFNGISHGYNNLYGHGNPDLYAALQPIGTKSVSFGNQAYALIGTGLLLANTYGDSLSMVGETGLYRDQLHGGFTFNLSDLVGRNTRNEVQRKLQNGNHSVWSPVSNDQGLNFSYSHETDINNNGLFDDSGFYSSFVSGKNTIYVGQKYSVDQALGLRDGNNAMSVLTAHNSNESFLSFTESASSGNLIGSKIDLDNSLSFNVMAYNGVHSDYDLREKGFLASLKHKSKSNSDFSIFIGQNNEMEGLLRTSGEGAFGNFAGESYHLGTTFNKQIANNVHLAGLFNYGLVTSRSDNTGFLSDVSDLKTSQFNVGMVVSGLGRNNNLMSLNLSQPLRVESGFTNLNIPGRLDQNGNVTHTTKRLSLEPSGRELNIDLGYEMKLFNGAIKVGSQLMFDAVHMESNNSETVYGIFKTSF